MVRSLKPFNWFHYTGWRALHSPLLRSCPFNGRIQSGGGLWLLSLVKKENSRSSTLRASKSSRGLQDQCPPRVRGLIEGRLVNWISLGGWEQWISTKGEAVWNQITNVIDLSSNEERDYLRLIYIVQTKMSYNKKDYELARLLFATLNSSCSSSHLNQV